jgi:transposase InsO family protein
MYHADTMEVILGNGEVVYQISIEDDYSRAYVSMDIFKSKHTYFVIISLLKAFRRYGIPELFHHDNGGEYNNTAVRWLLKQFNITDVPTEVENPKGNGKKENAHSQDRKYFYEKHNFRTIEEVEQSIPEYLEFRNNVKGQWARYGKTASEALKEAEPRKMSDDELKKMIRELYFEKKDRIVKKDGKLRFNGKTHYILHNF